MIKPVTPLIPFSFVVVSEGGRYQWESPALSQGAATVSGHRRAGSLESGCDSGYSQGLSVRGTEPSESTARMIPLLALLVHNQHTV